MTTGFSRSPKVVKGAFIELSEPFLGPVPNIIPFQYNPEKVTRKMSPWAPPEGEDNESSSDALSQPYDPAESFTRMELILDATDGLEDSSAYPMAQTTGVADRIAAIEKLMFPVSTGALGGLGDALGSLLGGSTVISRKRAPLVLFTWGAARILPVRISEYEIAEEAYAPDLYPWRAKITVTLKVLTPETLEASVEAGLARDMAATAYRYTHAQKEVLARAGFLTSIDSIFGILPF
ncbi:MAG: hypothetical protein J4N63_04340 [Chloroflexi bacterium]|nr:hypothetical protein [Chloroflexota bacterium]MCI0808363.1 hypothetical protein [Chloroflexota bacterium]